MENNDFIIDQTLFDLKLNEAKFYSDQGLYDEADKIYVSLIQEFKKLPKSKEIDIQIRQLESIRDEYQAELKQDKIASAKFFISSDSDKSEIEDIEARLNEISLKDEDIEMMMDSELCDEFAFGVESDKGNDSISKKAESSLIIHHTDKDKFSEKKDEAETDKNIEPCNINPASSKKSALAHIIGNDTEDEAVDVINNMIISAYQKSASHIYIEPAVISNFITEYPEVASNVKISNNALIRFRVDGLCRNYVEISNKLALQIILKLKIMAKIDINERVKPLYGKIKFKNKKIGIIDIKVITIPTTGYKEDVILKFFPSANMIDLSKLGFVDYSINSFVEILNKQSGLIFISTLSDSGRTTTLHSSLKFINSPAKKIWCIEDSVEIYQKGIRQVEIKPEKEIHYNSFFKAITYSAPDVIMVGDIVDYDSAMFAVKASLSGSIVLAGFTGAGVLDTLRKILEIGVNPICFADAMLSILAQKLIRRLCDKCKKPFINTTNNCNGSGDSSINNNDDDNNNSNDVNINNGNDNKNNGDFLEFLVNEFGNDIEAAHLFNLINKNREDIVIYQHSSDGCEDCSYTGYKGRIALHELLINSGFIKSLIKDNMAHKPDNTTYKPFLNSTLQCDNDIKTSFKNINNLVQNLKLNNSADKYLFYTFKQDGILKVIAGITDLDEIKLKCQ